MLPNQSEKPALDYPLVSADPNIWGALTLAPPKVPGAAEATATRPTVWQSRYERTNRSGTAGGELERKLTGAGGDKHATHTCRYIILGCAETTGESRDS